MSAKRGDGLPFLLWMSVQARGERWQPKEGRAKKGARSSYHYIGQGYVDLRGGKGLNVSNLTTPHARGLPSRQGLPNHERRCSVRVCQGVGTEAEGGLPDLANRNIGHPVFYLATLNGGRRA